MRLAPLFLIVLLAACGNDAPERTGGTGAGACEDPANITYRTDARLQFVRADGTSIKEIGVEIADTDSTIERGLMDRRCYPDDWGMLFVFPNAQQRTFYMQNTPRSLDILFFGPDSTLLNAAKFAEPFSPAVLPSAGPAQYVVEVPAGFTDLNGVNQGDRITWGAAAASAPAPVDTLAEG